MCLKKYFRLILLVISAFNPFNILGQTNPKASFQLSVNAGCAPLMVTITNTSKNATQFSWDFGNGQSSTVSQPSIIYTSQGKYDISLIAMDALGNSDTLKVTKAVTVNSIPNANFTFTTNSACLKNNQVSFINTSIGGHFYTWDFGDGNTSNLPNPFHSYLVSGNYIVSLQVSDSLGCSSFKQSTQPITIYKEPVFDFTSSTSFACDTSESISFTCPNNNIVTWHWDFGDGTYSNFQNPIHTYKSSGVFSVSLVGTTLFGCSDTIYKTNFITVNKKSSLDFNAPITSGCRPLSVMFQKNASENALTYSWKLGDGRIVTGDTVNQTYSDTGAFTITLIAEYQGTCIDSISKLNYIQVNGIAESSFTMDTLGLCKNRAVRFNSTSKNAILYDWNFGDGTTSNVKNPIHTYKNQQTYTTELTVTDTLGCADKSTNTFNIQGLNADFTSNETFGCVPLEVHFTTLSQTADKWFWSFGDGDTSHQQNPKHIYQDSGKFNVLLVIETKEGCRDSVQYNNYIITFADSISGIQGDTIKGCLPLPIDFSGNSIGSNQWLWDFGNGDSSTLSNPTYTYHSPGTYTVSLTTFNANGCSVFIENFATFQIDSIVPKISAIGFDCKNGLIQLTDSTKNILSWFWDFGDGTYSNLQSPIHQYPDTLVYSITLTLTNLNGCTHSVFFPNFIDFTNCFVNGQKTVDKGISGSSNNADTLNSKNLFANSCAPQYVQFNSIDSNSFSWYWDFGDGSTSVEENPMHIYNAPGRYDVMLISQNPQGFDTTLWKNQVTVSGPLARFTTATSYACDSVSVQFNNLSLASTNWLWNLSNNISSTLFSPIQKYPYSNNNYFVQLIAKDSVGCLASKVNIINFPKDVIQFSYPKTACVGDSILFTADDSTYTYHWSFGDGSTDSSISPKHVFTHAGTYSIQVISRNISGCEETYILDSVFVKGSNAEFDILDTTNCINQSFSFIPKEKNADSYLWKFGNVLTDTSKSPHIKIQQAGQHLISLTISKDACTNSYKSATPITVKNVSAQFVIQQITNCYPVQINLQDTSSNSVQWKWNLDNNIVTGVNTTSYNILDSSANISLQVMADNGCKDTMDLTFTPTLLKADFEISDTVGCAPLPIKFTNKSTNFVHSYWSFGDGDTSTSTNPTHVYQAAGIYSVRLISVSSDGCIDTMTFNNAIRINSIIADYSIAYNSSCTPMLVNFTNNAPEAISWKWDFGDGTGSTSESPIHIYNNSGKFDVSLIVSNSNGCYDTIINHEQIIVPGPITKFSVSDTLICGSKPVVFIDSSINAISWNWFFGDGTTSNLQNPTHTYSNKGIYEVMLITTDENACSGFYIFPTKIKVDVVPNADFSIIDTIACAPINISIQNNSQNVSFWNWDMGNGQTSTDSLSEYPYQTAGRYSISLVVQSEYGCTDSARFDSLVLHQTPNSQISVIPPVCENEKAFVLHAQTTGGIWEGMGITDSIMGYFNPSVSNVGQNQITYSFAGICPSSDTINITVKEAPQVDFIVDKNEACEELKVKFESNLFERISSWLTPSYVWKANDTVFGTQAMVEKTFSPGNYDISLEVNVSNGCSESTVKPSFIKVFDTIPSVVNIQRVSVLNDTKITIEWERNTEPEFNQYVIYRKSLLSDKFEVIALINDQNQTSYIDQALNTLDHVYCYKITIADKCGQELNVTLTNAHCSINVTSIKEDNNSVKVKWTPYIGRTVERYEIKRIEVGSNKTKTIASLNSNQFEFIDTTAYCNDLYSYKIIAKNLGNTPRYSISDTTNIKMKGIAHLQKSIVERATVKDNNSILIEWTALQFATEIATGYVVHRSENNLDFRPLTYVALNETKLIDEKVNVEKNRYFYKIEVINTCINKNNLTNIGSSVLLKAKQINDHSGKLDWTEYEGWENGVKNYKLQRLNEFNQWETIQILPFNIKQSIVNF